MKVGMSEWEIRELTDEELQKEWEIANNKSLGYAYCDDIGLSSDYSTLASKLQKEINIHQELNGNSGNRPKTEDINNIYEARRRIDVLRELVKRLLEDNKMLENTVNGLRNDIWKLADVYTDIRGFMCPEWDEGYITAAYINGDKKLCVKYEKTPDIVWYYTVNEDGLHWEKPEWL